VCKGGSSSSWLYLLSLGWIGSGVLLGFSFVFLPSPSDEVGGDKRNFPRVRFSVSLFARFYICLLFIYYVKKNMKV
jgi:hypothetical protein